MTCDGIYSFNSVEYNGEIALALFDKNDNIISVYEDDTYKIEGLAPYASEIINDPVPVFSINGMLSGLEDGTYSLRAVSKEEGRDDWQRLVSNEKISVQVGNGMAVFYTPTYAVSIDAITVDGTPDYDKQITLSASITNKSDNANAGTLDWEIVNPNGDVVRYGSEGGLVKQTSEREFSIEENGIYIVKVGGKIAKVAIR